MTLIRTADSVIQRLGIFVIGILVLCIPLGDEVVRHVIAVLGCCVFLAFVLRFKEVYQKIRNNKIARFLLFLFATILIFGVLSNQNIYESQKRFFPEYLCYLIVFFAPIIFIRKKNNYVVFMDVYVISVLIAALNGIYQHFRGVDIINHMPANSGQITASFGHHAPFGIFLASVLAGITVLLIYGRYTKLKAAFYIASVVIITSALFLSGARGALGAFVIILVSACVVYLCWRKGRGKKIVGLLTTIFFSLLILFYKINPIVKERVDLLLSFYLAGREDIWRTVLLHIKQNWLIGYGLAGYNIALPKGIVHAHNEMLQLWIMSGIFAPIAYLGVWYAILSETIKGFLRGNQEFLFWFIVCLTIFIGGIVDVYILGNWDTGPFFFLTVGMIASMSSFVHKLSNKAEDLGAP